MTYELLHAGFDTLDVAFAGALPFDALAKLEIAREEAQERQEEVLTSIGPGNVEMHVQGIGMRGGYAYVCDTGPLGCIWRFKKNSDASQWNIFASPNATMLLAYGYEGTRNLLWETLGAMGARVSDHSINRVDFAMDFQTRGFELHHELFVSHSHTKTGMHFGESESTQDRNQPGLIMRGRKLESVTIGKMPGRQIIVYDKKREAIEKRKFFWFKAWEKNRHDQELEVWRIEIRAGKKELKNKYQMRTFEDLETGVGDVIVNTLDAIRYVANGQVDTNISRQSLHPIWRQAQELASQKLTEFRSGLTPDQVRQVAQEQAEETYKRLYLGNAIGFGIAHGLSDDEIMELLPDMVVDDMRDMIRNERKHIDKSIRRNRERLHFI